MRSATLDALLPGRGVTCIKYDAEMGELAPEAAPVVEGAKSEPTPYKKSELVCCDARTWKRVYFGYAKKWSKVPWIAYEEDIDREEAERLFGKDIANRLVYSTPAEENDDRSDDEKNKGELKTATIYQIWDKDGGRKIRYVCEQYKDGYLKVEEDTLELTGFFNCPKPIQFIEKSNDLTPVAPYVLYENQAKELNRLTTRIQHIVSALKARGVYDAELGDDVANVMKADDNELVPSDKSSSLAAEKGLQNAIWFMPVGELIVVLKELYVARESCKQVIFEIMGLADIMRGASQASETLGAQQIKQTWGSLRLKRQQKEVQRYARDILRMMLEIAATKFSEETWAKMTGLPFLTEAQFAQASAMLQAAQMQAQLPGPDGQPNPQAQQQLQAAQAELQKPQWKQILGLLRDDIQRAYRIDIETNSTVEPEAVEDQKNIAEVMNALGQFLNGVSPLVANGTMPFQAAQAMMLAIVRRFRFGNEIEDYIKAMKPPASPDAGKQQIEAQKAKQEQEMHQADMQAKQQDFQQKKAEAVGKLQIAERENQLAIERMNREAAFEAQEHAFKMAELERKAQVAEIVASSKIRAAQATASQKEARA